jgi:hypothetical protein
VLNRKFSNFNSRTNHSRDVGKQTKTKTKREFNSLKNITISEYVFIFHIFEQILKLCIKGYYQIKLRQK